MFGIRRWLGLTLLTVLVPAALVALALEYASVQRQRAAALQTDLELARSVATTFEAYVEGVVRTEHAIGLALPPLLSASPERASAYLAGNAEGNPAVWAMAWAEPDGRVVAASAPDLLGANVAGRDYFRAVLEGGEWSVGDLLRDRTSDEGSVVVARAVRDEAGGLAGVVLAAIDPSQLGRALDFQRAPGGAIGIVDRDGWTVYRYPGPELTWDERRRPPAGPWLETVADGRERSGFVTLPWDERTMAAGFVPIRGIDWVAVAARPADAVMAPIRREAARDVALLGGVWLAALLGALLVGRRITRPIKALRARVAALAGGEPGDPVEVSGPRELRELAASFNAMAEKLRRREREREEYLHLISHDLRTPLTAIAAQAQLLQLAGPGTDERVRRRATTIATAADRMAAMIRDLIESARLAHGQVELRRRPVDLPALVEALLPRAVDPSELARVAVAADEGLPPVDADPDRLERVLTNLVTNALKYGRPGSPVRVRVARRGQEVVVTVADEGPGIAPGELPQLFQRYGRTASGRGRRDSLGLGLYIARLLVEAHGGRVWAASEPGEGSTFGFALPVRTAGHEPAADEARTERNQGPSALPAA